MAGSTLIGRALEAPDPPADPASERILDAALALVAAHGIGRPTMDEIAARAGVGRMTVYRRFGDRERLIDALAAREVRRCLAALEAAIDPTDPLAERVADGFAAALRLIREHPLLARFARHEPEAALDAMNAGGGAIFGLARSFATQMIRVAQERGEVTETDPEEAAELLVRLCVSFVLIPATSLPIGSDADARALGRRLIAPILA